MLRRTAFAAVSVSLEYGMNRVSPQSKGLGKLDLCCDDVSISHLCNESGADTCVESVRAFVLFC